MLNKFCSYNIIYYTINRLLRCRKIRLEALIAAARRHPNSVREDDVYLRPKYTWV